MADSRSFWRSLVVILWFMGWPLTELVGRPPEVYEDVTWRRGLRLLGVAVLISGAIIVAFLLSSAG